MEVNVEQGKLAKALGIVSRVASSGRGGLAILNNVLIRAHEKKVTLTATNLDMAIVDYLPTSNSVDGAITVPARLLADYIANLPRGEVDLKVEGDALIISSGGNNSRMNGVAAEDFPDLPEIDEEKAVRFQIGVEEFKAGLATVKLATSTDTSRPALTGVLFDSVDGNLNIVASDGYRLVYRRFIGGVKSEVRAIVPGSTISEVLSVVPEDGEVEILFDETQVRFRFGEIEITSKLIDGVFPDYTKLWPVGDNTEIEVGRAALVRVSKLALLFAKSVANVVMLEANVEAGELKVSAVLNEYGENSSVLKMKSVGADEKTTLNGKFLVDALNCLSGEQAKMRIYTSGQVLLEEDDYKHMVMPTNRR